LKNIQEMFSQDQVRRIFMDLADACILRRFSCGMMRLQRQNGKSKETWTILDISELTPK